VLHTNKANAQLAVAIDGTCGQSHDCGDNWDTPRTQMEVSAVLVDIAIYSASNWNQTEKLCNKTNI